MGESYRTNVYKFDGTNWSEVTGLPQGITLNASSALGTNLYAIGGLSSVGNITNVYQFLSTPITYTNQFGIDSDGTFKVVEDGETKTPIYTDTGATNIQAGSRGGQL